MQSFIFDYYGYNVSELVDNHFDYQGYRFVLISTTENESTISKLDEFLVSLRGNFDDDIVYFVKNRYNQYISLNDSTNILLLTYKLSSVSLDTLLKMHQIYFNNGILNLNEIINLWEQRIEYLENQCLVMLNFDNPAHKELYEHAMFAIGMAENALQYISDLKIDFKENFVATLTHRRLKKLDKWELFNPFNLIFEHSSRDLAELYKNDIIDLNQLIELTKKYQYKINEYQYLLARILFPVSVFDILEDIYLDKNYDYTDLIYKAIQSQQQHIKKVKTFYKTMINEVNIRPIRWLDLN